jgi:hypothetical protein
MDPISLGAMPKADYTAPEPPVPEPPEASDVQEFQNLYNQDGSGTVPVAAPHQNFQGMLIHLMGGPAPGSVSDNVFVTAMERMAEMHEKNCTKLDTLVDRISSSTNLSPQELLEAQMTIGDTNVSLTMYQAFEKKSDEGIRTLMTCQ